MKVLLGLSGGLDSTYAAIALRDSGHEVTGAVLQMHPYAPSGEARQSADETGIDLVEVDCRERFESTVVADFAREYYAGRTPNPCVVCNPAVKFAVLFETAEKMGFDAIATGHYAVIGKEEKNGEVRYFVVRSPDSRKDQSYMLYRLPQKILSKLLLPMAELTKDTVRRDAKERGLSSADRPESQEICFIPDGDYATYLENRFGKCPEGNFVDRSGKVLGRHKGILHYTVGQRRGLGIAVGERAFIVEIRPDTNEIVLAPASESRGIGTLLTEAPILGRLSENDLPCEISCEAVVRYHAKPVPCTARIESDRMTVTLVEPIPATPGQSVVLYDGEGAILAGGRILKTV